jgi:FAD-linked sulfhydryl oxidase
MLSRSIPVLVVAALLGLFIYVDHTPKGHMPMKDKPIQTEKKDSPAVTVEAKADPSQLVKGIKYTKAELGRAGWLILHSMSVKYPLQPEQKDKDRMRAFLKYFAEQYPCEECSKHFVKYLEAFPPLLECRDDIARYLCQLHNEVNKFLKKPIFDCDRVYEVWGGDCGCSVKMEVPFECNAPPMSGSP